MNRVILTGRLANDVEVKKTTNGTSVISFAVAVSRDYKDENGNYPADFFNCVAWRGTADYIGSYFSKGMMIGVEGKLTTRKFTNNEGRNVQVTEINVEKVERYNFAKKEEAPAEPVETAPSGKIDIGLDDLAFY